MPRSWMGWVSIGIFLLGIFLLGILQFFIHRLFGFRVACATLIVAGAIALLAVLWKKERSVLVLAVLLVGALAAVFVGAEILSPH